MHLKSITLQLLICASFILQSKPAAAIAELTSESLLAYLIQVQDVELFFTNIRSEPPGLRISRGDSHNISSFKWSQLPKLIVNEICHDPKVEPYCEEYRQLRNSKVSSTKEITGFSNRELEALDSVSPSFNIHIQMNNRSWNQQKFLVSLRKYTEQPLSLFEKALGRSPKFRLLKAQYRESKYLADSVRQLFGLESEQESPEIEGDRVLSLPNELRYEVLSGLPFEVLKKIQSDAGTLPSVVAPL